MLTEGAGQRAGHGQVVGRRGGYRMRSGYSGWTGCARRAEDSHPPGSAELNERQTLHHSLVAGLFNRWGKLLITCTFRSGARARPERQS